MREKLEVETTWSVRPSSKSHHYEDEDEAFAAAQKILRTPGVTYVEIHKGEKVLR